jgi:hypothetical protein
MYGLNKMTESQVYKSKVLQVWVRGSDIEGQGLFATRPISSGQRIEYFDGYEIDHPTRHSLTFNGTRIEPTGSLRFSESLMFSERLFCRSLVGCAMRHHRWG